MTFALVLVVTDPSGAATSEVLASGASASQCSELSSLVRDCAALSARAEEEVADGRARPVQVVAVDKAVFPGYVLSGGRSGLKAKPVEVGEVFPSAAAASRHLGCRANDVSLRLSTAARARGAQENTPGGSEVVPSGASVRGVTFCYADEEGRI